MLTSNGYVLDESPDRLGHLESLPVGLRADASAMWSRLRSDGYLYLDGHLDPELVESFRGYYFSQLATTGLVDPGFAPRRGLDAAGEVDRANLRRILFNEIVPGDSYAALTAHPAIRDWFAWFLDAAVHLHRRKIIRHVRPGEFGIGTATAAHYDLLYLREGSDRVLSMWIPLGDCPVEMGGLAYLEGSHHWVLAREREDGVRPPARTLTADLPGLAEQHDARWLMADYKAGDVVVHSAYVVHAATDNVDAGRRIRLSTDIRYQRVSDPIDWRWQEHWHDQDGL